MVGPLANPEICGLGDCEDPFPGREQRSPGGEVQVSLSLSAGQGALGIVNLAFLHLGGSNPSLPPSCSGLNLYSPA